MNKLPGQPVPLDSRRIVLLNPTRYLGNLLLAGGLIQDFAASCRRGNREFLLVLDAAFQELCAEAVAGIPVLWYPRQAMRRTPVWRRLGLFLDFLARLRAFQADLAFNLEEDSLSSRLTQLSGASFRLGCSPARHAFGYEHVLPVAYAGRHRWYSYRDVFAAVGMPATGAPTYMNLYMNQVDETLIQKLGELGMLAKGRYVAIHPAATKDYKQWPETAFIELCILLINKGFIPVLLGAGHAEWQRCDRIQRFVAGVALAHAVNLCDKLSLAELARVFRLCVGIVGNDSGPSHLASAQGLPGVVIFGPSEPTIWGPLGDRSRVLRKAELCDPRCTRRACLAGYRCLHEIRPDEVLATLSTLIDASPATGTP